VIRFSKHSLPAAYQWRSDPRSPGSFVKLLLGCIRISVGFRALLCLQKPLSSPKPLIAVQAEHSKPQCVDRLRRSNTHSERYCCLRQRIIGVAMMSARHLAGQTQVCGCQLQSRRVQARTGRRCTTIRAATAVPAEVCKWQSLVIIGC